ncbi:hypothetical protein ES708_04776 [subsurface metagenome]
MPRLEFVNVRRTQRQHSSINVVIPKAVRVALGIKAGDYVVFSSHPGTNAVEFTKFIPKGKKHGRDSRDSGRKDQGG